MSSCNRQENIEDPIRDASNFDCKKNIGNGLIITAVAATTTGIFLALRAVNVEKPKALLVSTALACWLSLPM